MAEATFKVFRGDRLQGELVDYQVPIAPGIAARVGDLGELVLTRTRR